MRFTIFVFLFLTGNWGIFAQVVPNQVGSISPDPNSGGLKKQVEIPVNAYTGMAQVTVPLHSYESAHLSFNAFLSYSTGGIRVADVAGNAGLGWTLNAGGIITRTLQGVPDDFNPNGYWNQPEPAFYEIPGSSSWDYLRNSYNFFYNDSLDSQLDLFQFNFGGYVGRFFIGKNGEVVVAPMQNIKIKKLVGTVPESPYSTLQGFIVSTPDGCRYLFDQREITTANAIDYPSKMMGKPYVTAWYLSKFWSIFSKDTIKLSYTSSSYTRNIQYPSTIYAYDTARIVKQAAGTITLTTKKLYQVTFPENYSMHFLYEFSDRCDLADKALKEVNVGDTVVRFGYKFSYNYSTANGFIEYNSPCNNSGNDVRLMLKSITEYTPKGTKPPQTFVYEDGLYLPSVFSPSQDHWGFFNGKPNVNLVPGVGAEIGADRSSSLRHTQAGVLKGVIYPTGATTGFVYEQNDKFSYSKQLRSITFGPGTNSAQSMSITKYTNSPTLVDFDLVTTNSDGYGSIEGLCSFDCSIRNASNVVVWGPVSVSQADAMERKTFWVDLPSGNYTFYWTANSSNTCTNTYYNTRMTWENDVVDLVNQSVGGLRVKKVFSTDGLTSDYATVKEYKYVNESGNSSGFISELPRYDYSYKLSTITRYNSTFYTYSSNKLFGVRSGSPVNFLNYTHGSPVGYKRVEEFSGTEYMNSGKQVYEFTSFADINRAPSFNQFPYAPIGFSDWALGLPKRTLIYSADNVLKSEVINQYNFFNEEVSDVNFKSIKLGVNAQKIFFGYYGNNENRDRYYFTAQTYYPVTGRAELTKMTMKEYSDNDVLTTETAISYDETYFLPKSSTVKVNNKLNQYVTSFTYYPFDYTIGGATSLLRDSMVLTPVSNETWISGDGSGRLINASIIEHGTTPENLVAPVKTWTLEAADPVPVAAIGSFNPGQLIRNTTYFKAATLMENYNSRGLSLQQTDARTNLSSAIIFDAGQGCVLARVNNATQTEIAYTSFESTEKGSWMYAGMPVSSGTAATGKYLYNLTNGTITRSGIPLGKNYILSLWAMNGVPSVSGVSLTRSELNTKTGWTYYEYNLTGGTVSISGTATVDELRLYPKQATMETTCYEPLIGIITVCDKFNKITSYEYDNLNRLRRIKDQDRNILKVYCYDFAGQRTECLSNPCPQPVITDIQVSGRNLTIYYIPPPGAYACTVRYTNVATGQTNNSTLGCNVPRTQSLPSAGTYNVFIGSYSPGCSEILSAPYTVTVN